MCKRVYVSVLACCLGMWKKSDKLTHTPFIVALEQCCHGSRTHSRCKPKHQTCCTVQMSYNNLMEFWYYLYTVNLLARQLLTFLLWIVQPLLNHVNRNFFCKLPLETSCTQSDSVSRIVTSCSKRLMTLKIFFFVRSAIMTIICGRHQR